MSEDREGSKKAGKGMLVVDVSQRAMPRLTSSEHGGWKLATRAEVEIGVDLWHLLFSCFSACSLLPSEEVADERRCWWVPLFLLFSASSKLRCKVFNMAAVTLTAER